MLVYQTAMIYYMWTFISWNKCKAA